MGHIVNAKSTRLGKSIVWCDQWYVNKKYYTEYLHAIFRIRLYCYYIFTERHLDRKAIFMSHFELYKFNKKIHIEIYYYDGKWETEFEEYKIELYRQHYDMPMQKDPEMRKPYFLISSLKFLVLFNWMFYIKRKKKIKVLIKSRLIRLFRLVRIAKYSAYIKKFMFLKNKKFFYWNKVNLHFILFLIMYVNAKITISKNSLWIVPSRNTIFRRIYYIGGCLFEINYWLKAGSYYLKYIFKIITKFNKIFINFFLTNNNCVNAKFLSRYIARKLQQGYPIKILLNPIKKELNYLLALSLMPVSSFYKINIKKFLNKKIKNDFMKITYKMILLYLLNKYNNIKKKLFNKEKIYLMLDTINIYIFFNKIYKEKSYIKFLSISYFKKKILYIYLIENKHFYYNLNYLIYPKINKFIGISKVNKFLTFFENIYKYFLINKFNINNNNILFINNNSLKGLGYNLTKFIKYNYINYCYGIGYNKLNINFLRERITKKSRSTNLIGYKMYLMGRFTRKQRAGHLWFSKGKVPITAIKLIIDYAYYSLALKNSTITVKIWLYKKNELSNKYYLKMF